MARILKDLDFRLRVNHKRIAAGSAPDRDQQFTYIASQRVKFAGRGLPIISIDTKKRELVGNFKNQGHAWGQSPQAVNDHDFRSQADGIAIPHGIYDVTANYGFVVVGTSHDTPDFAVDNLVRWWQREGRQRYPGASELLVLADSGGSNAPRVRCFKYALQTRLVDPYHLTVTVCHYPSGASKWNPIDHRLFSEISKNWAGHPAAQLPDHPQPHPYHHHGHRAARARRVWSTTSITGASRYPMPSSLPSPSSPTIPNRSATIRSVPGLEEHKSTRAQEHKSTPKSALILAPALRDNSEFRQYYEAASASHRKIC